MTIMEKVKKINFTDLVINICIIVSVSAALYWFVVFIKQNKLEQMAAMEKRKNIICPSLLSIGRSGRDTLIIMKNEDLCNRYVLDNLK